MKTSLRKLRGLAPHRHGEQKDRRDLRSLAQLRELAQASRDMQDMKDCYDSLLSAAAATANSAYEFSESLREMGACLLEKTALNDDEESGKVLLMLGKLQFELQKLVDSYRSHIFQTITVPSESLLSELRIVEEMKQDCDEKRDTYESMLTRHREKGRGRSGKGENFSTQQLLEAHDDYDKVATLFVFRLKSLKQGQSRSLLTQAARHHAAQLYFFRKSLKSLEAVEPHVKLVTEQQHIDYNFTSLEDEVDNSFDDDDEEEEEEDDMHNDRELSFDYRQHGPEQYVASLRNSVEVDEVDVTFPRILPLGVSKEDIDRSSRKSFLFRGELGKSTQSAPLVAEKKFDQLDKLKQMRPSYSPKLNSYVLPTPVDTKGPNSPVSGSLVARTLKTSLSSRAHNSWHSSPLDQKKHDKFKRDEKISGPNAVKANAVLRESNNNISPSQLPPPLADGLLFSRLDAVASHFEKIERYAFSGPIPRKPWSSTPALVEQPQLSGPLLQNPVVLQPSPKVSPKISPKVSPKASPSASPPFVSSPKISELHELPRPPANSTSKSSMASSFVGHSAPLVPKSQVLPTTSRSLVSNGASPLPAPSQVITRSFSIPSSGLRAMALNVSKPAESTNNAEMADSVATPSLTPILLSNTLKSTTASVTANQTIQVRDVD